MYGKMKRTIHYKIIPLLSYNVHQYTIRLRVQATDFKIHGHSCQVEVIKIRKWIIKLSITISISHLEAGFGDVLPASNCERFGSSIHGGPLYAV